MAHLPGASPLLGHCRPRVVRDSKEKIPLFEMPRTDGNAEEGKDVQLARETLVPAKLPMILKQFCKAAIRTQPYDLLKWSGAYFRALARGEEPPAKFRLEYPTASTSSGLTFGFLRVLLRQFGDYNKTLSTGTMLRRWDCLCLDRRDFTLIATIGKFRGKCQVKRFLAVAVGLLTSNLLETMILVCQLFTHEPDGGSAMIPATLFMEIYGYLAGLRCDGGEREPSDAESPECIVYDELDDVTSPSPTVSSRDTIADIELESELTSRNDADTSKSGAVGLSSEMSEGAGERSLGRGRRETTLDESDTSGNPDDNAGVGPIKSLDEGSRGRMKDIKLLARYPEVAGIGSRVSAEEVTAVAVWISECARCQEGMVGPRNIRHFHCPPLDPRRSSPAR